MLKSALDEQNDKFVVQVLDCAGKMDGISLKLSDGRFSTWIVECEDDLRDDLKYASYKKSIINIAKYKVKKGSIIKIVDYDVIEENGEYASDRKFYDQRVRKREELHPNKTLQRTHQHQQSQ